MKNNFLILWLAGVISTVLALPYIFALQREVIAQAGVPLLQIGLISVAQSAVLLAAAVYFGLKLSQKIHLPLFETDISFKEKLRRLFKLAVPLGIATALVIKFGDIFFTKYIPQLVAVSEEMPVWKALLVAPYGGVVEELLLRLFVVSLFAWLISKILKVAEPVKSSAVMWTAIIGASILFGIGHLPATATIVPLTSIVVTRALLLNGIGGVVFGWLYWKKGLEYAMVAHFTTDIVLHAIL